MPGDGETHRGVEAETQGIRRAPRRLKPPGADRDRGAGQGRKRRGKRMQETAVGSVTQHGHRDEQRRLACGGCWRRSGGRRSAPGEEVESG